MSRPEEKQLKLNNVRLGDVLENTITGEWGAECTSGNGVRVLRTTNFTNTGELSFENVVERQIDAKKVAKKKLCPGDLIVEKSGGTKDNPVGRVVHFDNPDGVYLCNNFTQILRPLKSIHSRFLFYTLYFYYRTNKSEGLYNKTTGIQNLQMGRYLDLKFSFPPLAEQKRIAEELDNICAAKKDAEAIVEKLKLLAKSQFVEMFGDVINNDRGWPCQKLQNVATLLNGRAYSQSELLSSGKYPVLRVGNFFSTKDWYYSDLELDEDKYCDTGDLLFAWSASFGPKIWDGGKVIYHYHIWKILLSDCIDRGYAYAWLSAVSDKIKSEAHGITMVHTTKGSMEKRFIPIPPLALQRAYTAFIEQLDKSLFEAQALIGKLDLLYRAKLQEYFG